jgi:hypothetical protein
LRHEYASVFELKNRAMMLPKASKRKQADDAKSCIVVRPRFV